MTTWAITMVRDEVDVIEGTLRHMADEGVAGILVADNRSVDGTRELLDKLTAPGELPCELVVVTDDEPGYFQSRKMTALADEAHYNHGADWIVPFDADELWLAPDRVGVVLEQLPPYVHVVRAQLFHHFRTAIDADVPDPFDSMMWRQREPAPLPKIAYRWREDAVIDPGNHGVDLVADSRGVQDGPLHVRHFPYRSEGQFVSKARNGAEAYAAAGDAIPADIGAHWRQYGTILDRLGEDGLAQVYREHFWFLAPTESGLVCDPAPYMRWRR